MSRKLLDDKFYIEQFERLGVLPGHPKIPKVEQDYTRALRRISEWDSLFIARLISYFIDNAERCPTPQELCNLAGQWRNVEQKSLGKEDCPHCGGLGWIRYQKMVYPAGVDPYLADVSKRCFCRD